MTALGYIIAALLLPLFPFSMLFNRVFACLGNPWLRMGMLLLWPQLGMMTLLSLGQRPPVWLVWWAVATAALYALRALSLSNLNIWIGYMATSAWALLWPAVFYAPAEVGRDIMLLQTLGISLPFVLLAWFSGRLEQVCGAAYAGICGGLSSTMPKAAGLLTLCVLAAVGTPLAPGFFALLSTALHSLGVTPLLAMLILAVWLMWAWSGVRLLRGFIVGPESAEPMHDLGALAGSLIGLVLLALVLAGLSLSGELI